MDRLSGTSGSVIRDRDIIGARVQEFKGSTVQGAEISAVPRFVFSIFLLLVIYLLILIIILILLLGPWPNRTIRTHR
jgi:hypothetical protein